MQQDYISDKHEEHSYLKCTSGDHLDLQLEAGMGTRVADWFIARPEDTGGLAGWQLQVHQASAIGV